MTKKTNDVLMRSDRVLVVALAVILAAASAAVGATVADRPHTDEVAAAVSAKPVAAAPVAVPSPVAQPAAEVAPVPASTTDLAMTQLLAEHRCLSEVMYYEARGEGQEGQMAIAEVVFHRLRHGHYGRSICAVVYEGVGTSTCQFSFACGGQLAARKSAAAWRSAETLAARILTGEVALRDITGNATHFHAISVAPGARLGRRHGAHGPDRQPRLLQALPLPLAVGLVVIPGEQRMRSMRCEGRGPRRWRFHIAEDYRGIFVHRSRHDTWVPFPTHRCAMLGRE